jgi:pimeloyl-ACP methyl ester carboxylesterase
VRNRASRSAANLAIIAGVIVAVAVVTAVVSVLLGVVLEGSPVSAAAVLEREVTFTTSDSLKVSATLVGSGASGVVLGHMLGGDRADWLPFARRLAGGGYAVVALDFRGHGKTPKRPIANLEREMVAAVTFLKQQGAQRVALVGASMGGTAAVKAAALGAAAAVIAISSPQTYGAFVTASDLRRITVPSLWIVGGEDADFVKSMRIMSNGVRGERRFQEFPGSWHGTQFFDSPYAETFRNLMMGFLKRALPPS